MLLKISVWVSTQGIALGATSALPFTSQHSRTHSLHIRIAILVTRTALATHCSGFYRQATTGRVLEPSFLVHTLLLFDDSGLLSPSDELTRTSLLLTTHCQTSNQAALLPLALATMTHCRPTFAHRYFLPLAHGPTDDRLR